MTQDPRGMIQQQGNIMRIDNAFVEEVSNPDFSSTGFIIISYAAPGAGRSVTIQTLQLNVSRNTVILNSRGQRLSLYRIRKGMWVNVVFSARQTRSIPPQANAYLIIVRQDIQQPTDFTIARIASVDPENGFLVTGNPNDINSQTRYVVSSATITNRFGNPIGIQALRPGQMVRITHATFQTASIPPQTTAFHVQLL